MGEFKREEWTHEERMLQLSKQHKTIWSVKGQTGKQARRPSQVHEGAVIAGRRN